VSWKNGKKKEREAQALIAERQRKGGNKCKKTKYHRNIRRNWVNEE